MDLSDALYGAFTRGKDVPTDVGELVSALGGTRAAAAQLGVAQRTVQRWMTTTGAQRRKAPASSVAAMRTAVRTSPAQRAAAVGSRRAARLRSTGAKVRARATAGVVSGGRAYMRPRQIDRVELTGAQLGPALDAFLDGDDARAAQLFTDAMGDAYVSGWEFEDVSTLDLLR